MLRESNVQTLTWADKTMSVLKARQLEACESRLAGLPTFGLFSGCDDSRAETLWACSFAAQEQPKVTTLHTMRSLTAQVLTALPAEAALLSIEEHMLLERLLALEGTAELLDWEETSAAEGLVRRLWCTIRREEERIFVHLPMELAAPLRLILSSRAHEDIRANLFRYDAIIRALLYIGGLLHSGEPLSHLMTDVLKDTYANNATLAMRYLRTSYDYMVDDHGEMLLLHPGLAEPERMLAQAARYPNMELQLNDEIMIGAMSGLLPEERAPYGMMSGLLSGAVRPEITVDEAAQDLLVLAKQGVSLQAMNEVLGTLLMVQPTEAMYAGVRQLYMAVPRWGSMQAGAVQ